MERTNFTFLIDHPTISESMLTRVLQNYSKLRDFHNDPPTFPVPIHVCNLISTKLNASMVPLSNFKINTTTINFIKIFAFDYIEKVEQVFLDQSFKNLTLPSVTQVDTFSYNYVYCSTIKKVEHETFSLITSLLRSADTATWISLVTSIILVTFLVQRVGKLSDGWYAWIATISVLISPGMSGKIRTKSLLFLAWMSGCLVLVTFYSGDLTSLVVCPVPELRVTSFEQLLKNNFSLTYEDPGMPIRVRFAVATSLENSVKQGLLKLIDNREIVKGNMNFYEKFIFGGKKTASILPWMLATYRANKGNDMIQERRVRGSRCYIGEEARFPRKRYFLFAGNNELNVLVAQYFGWIVEAGFFDIWWRENLGIATSRRVQSRPKVISATRLEHEVHTPESLKLEGNLMDVMFLWMIGLVGSTFVFIAHFSYSRKIKAAKIY